MYPEFPPKLQNMGWALDGIKNNLNSQQRMTVKNKNIQPQPKITSFY